MAANLNPIHDALLDLDGVDYLRPASQHPIAYVVEQAQYHDVRFSIVVSNRSSDDYREAALRARDNTAGIAIRAHIGPTSAARATVAEVSSLMDEFELSPRSTDLILDLGPLDAYADGAKEDVAKTHVRMFQGRAPWRDFFLASTSAPPTDSVRSGHVKRFARLDRALWRQLTDEVAGRLPAFSDYGITGPRAQDDSPLRGPSPNIRYTTDSELVFLKGRRDSEEEDDDDVGPTYPDLCNRLMKLRGTWASRSFSWGDQRIYDAGRGNIRAGGGEQWVQNATNHHLTQVVTELGNRLRA